MVLVSIPRAVYSVLTGATAIWTIMLLPRVANFWSMVSVILASVAGGSLAIMANTSVPGGIFERSKPRPWPMAAALAGSAITCWRKDTIKKDFPMIGLSRVMTAWSMGFSTK